MTNFATDRLFGALNVRSERAGTSPTVYNFGYIKEIARRYPWVAALSGGLASDGPVRGR